MYDLDIIRKGAEDVSKWVERHNFQAYDPGDGDLSILSYLTFNRHFLKRLLTASVLRSPIHIRPWIGIRPHRSTKGMGYMGWGYVKMFKLTRSDKHRKLAEFCFDWLMHNRSPANGHYCWGNHFSFSTRAGTIPKHTPTIVWSSLIAHAFLEASEVFGNTEYFNIAASVAEWVKTLPREETSTGTCLSYVPFKQSSIHNSNMLGAALLARVGMHSGDQEAVRLAKEAMRYSCSRQNEDGSWFYGEDPKYHWIDNFHTGYNLDCLKRYISWTGDREYEGNLKIGVDYFKANFFESDGRPKYYHNSTYPIDVQCCAQAIDTLAFFSDKDPSCLETAFQVARWTIQNMQGSDGHFYYRDLGYMKVKTPMFHWGQGTMFKALSHLLAQSSERRFAASGA